MTFVYLAVAHDKSDSDKTAPTWNSQTDKEVSCKSWAPHTIPIFSLVFSIKLNFDNKWKTHVFVSTETAEIDGAARDRKNPHKISLTEPMAPSM